MTCNIFINQRKKYVKPYYYRNPNTLKFNALMNLNNDVEIKKLCSFIEILTEEVRQTYFMQQSLYYIHYILVGITTML